MDDETEDKILYQTYISHMKLVSKIAVGLPTGFNMPLGYFWRTMRSYALKPEVLICVIVLFIMLFYLQVVDVWSRTLLGKIHYITTSKASNLHFLLNKPDGDGKVNWEFQEECAAAYAIQGHRASMEDRFVVNRNINNTGVSLFAVFDGHGGQFAANYARDKLIPNINKKVVDLKNIIMGKESPDELNESQGNSVNQVEPKLEENTSPEKRKKSFRKTTSTSLTDDCLKELGVTDPEILNKLDSLQKTVSREVRPCRSSEKPEAAIEMRSYIEDNEINYSKLLKDEVLAVDRSLVEAAKKNLDVAGSTALIAILENNQLIVANVGDSRGVMCDGRGNAIPLSFDHKPQQQREKTRIKKAGGVVSFHGVWRVAGILATSRALGDYPLKEKKWVIADPDVLVFDLKVHNPMFLILASDGLWDTFSNEEAVAFVKERIDEPFFGAKSITIQSYYRGSLDNITVLVIDLRDQKCKKSST